MALNQFMHPRNIYREKRNFSLLAAEFPEFEKHVKLFPNGNTTIDFSDVQAVRCLTQCLLRKDFGLKVDIPPNRLVPAVPQRLNYVLWIEDLVQLSGTRSLIRGLDIGVGSSCIFPLLVCKMNPSWMMTGTESDHESFLSALNNVNSNALSSRIKLFESDNWCDVVASEPFTFSMCNPPFFGKEEHLEEVNEQDSGYKSNSSVKCCPGESMTLGGETFFVSRLINDSFDLRDKVNIFTVMLGKKSSLLHLKKLLKQFQEENDNLSFTWTQFCQGRTMRWGLAWSFNVKLDVKDVSTRITKTQKPIGLNPIPYKKGMHYSIEGLTDYLLTWIIQDLEIKTYHLTRLTKHSSEIILTSQINTWSNQRRKKRQQKQQQHQLQEGNQTPSSDHTGTSEEEKSPEPVVYKRKDRDDDEEEEEYGDTSLESVEVEEPIMKRLREEVSKPSLVGSSKGNIQYLLHTSICLKKEKQGISLRMKTLEGSLSPETTHQILQFFKNKFMMLHP